MVIVSGLLLLSEEELPWCYTAWFPDLKNMPWGEGWLTIVTGLECVSTGDGIERMQNWGSSIVLCKWWKRRY